MRKIILASASPRRRELLEKIGVSFEVCPSKGKEQTAETDPGAMVEELSREKCLEVFSGMDQDCIVIGADTVVALDGKILGKPKSPADAVHMLSLLRGRTHQVFTGVTVMNRESGKTEGITFHETTQVSFYPMSDREIEDYVAGGEPMDKAGAYGIQGKGAVFIREIQGDYSNVVGLPLARLYQEMKNMGIQIKGRKDMYKACIFDLDGTIADTVESIAYVGNKTLEHFHLPPIPVKDYNFYAGNGADELVRKMLAAVPGGEEADYEQVRSLYRKWFEENPFYHVKPFDGIIGLLEGLKQEGLKIAVLSNKPHVAAVEVVEKIFGKDMFHKVQGQTEKVPRKPSPIGALTIAEEFSAKPEECLYLGDTDTDMETGHRAGMFTIGVTWGFRPRSELEEHRADLIVDKPEEILEFVQKANKNIRILTEGACTG